MPTLTPKQEVLIGAYAGTKTANRTAHLDLFMRGKTPYTTNAATVKLDEIVEELRFAGIVPRGADFTGSKVNGIKRVTITPDVIADAVPVRAIDNLEMQSGEVAIINGQKIPKKQLADQKAVRRLKTSIENTKNYLCAKLRIDGKVTLPISKDEIDFGFNAQISESYSSSVNLLKTMVEHITDFEDETGMYPDKIEVGSAIVQKMMNDTKLQDALKAFGGQIVNKGNNKGEMVLFNVFGLDVTTLPNAKDLDGNKIDYSSKIVLSNTAAFIPIFCGIEVARDNGQLQVIEADIFIDETAAEKKAASKEIFGKSAFIPVIANKDFVKVLDVTIS